MAGDDRVVDGLPSVDIDMSVTPLAGKGWFTLLKKFPVPEENPTSTHLGCVDIYLVMHLITKYALCVSISPPFLLTQFSG